MKIVLKVAIGLPAVLFIVMGLRWLVAPLGIAPELGFDLADGIGRSSQIGDFAAFFLTVGICTLLGIVSDNRVWFYPPLMLLGLAALGRLLAWLLHDAALATGMILFEIIVSLMLLGACRWLGAAAQEATPEA